MEFVFASRCPADAADEGFVVSPEDDRPLKTMPCPTFPSLENDRPQCPLSPARLICRIYLQPRAISAIMGVQFSSFSWTCILIS